MIPEFVLGGISFETGVATEVSGDVWKRTALLIQKDSSDPTPGDLIENDTRKSCCFCLPVFADLSDTSELKNDVNGFLWSFGALSTDATIYLEKAGVGDVATLNDNTYGTFYPFGFESTTRENYIGYQLNWRDVLGILGHGTYRVRVETTPIFGDPVVKYSFGFKLRPYNSILSDSTVRMTFFNNNLIGDWQNEEKQKNFLDLNWRNEIRLPGSMISHEQATYEVEEVRYNDGTRVDVTNDQEKEYTLYIGGLPHEIHRYITTEILQSDRIEITDYNSENSMRGVFVDKAIKPNSDYDIDWANNPLNPPAEVKFKLKTNNLRKRIC